MSAEEQKTESLIPQTEETKQGISKEETDAKKKRLLEKIKLILLVKMMKDDSESAEIIPHLYLGSLGAAFTKKKLLASNIKRIITACDSVQSPFKEFTYMKVNVADSQNQSISDLFEETNKFIQEGVMAQENVFVHCYAGKSRSTSFIMAFLIKTKQMNVDQALALVKSKRPIAQPNSNFMVQLQKYYDSLYKINIAKEIFDE